LSKEDEDEIARANEEEKSKEKIAKGEDDLEKAIVSDEKNKADLDAAHRDGSSEGLGKVITTADKERTEMEKKVAENSKKIGKENTDDLTSNAKEEDAAMKKQFPNKAAQASIKAFSPKSSLAQKG